MEIYPVKGTHDLYNEEANLYRDIESRCIFVASMFNYQEIRTPIIEHTNLFVRGVGDSSDIVNSHNSVSKQSALTPIYKMLKSFQSATVFYISLV